MGHMKQVTTGYKVTKNGTIPVLQKLPHKFRIRAYGATAPSDGPIRYIFE